MALKKMKKTPTGWGTGYTNIDVVGCLRITGIKVQCELVSHKPERKAVYLTGTDVIFSGMEQVSYHPNSISGFAKGKMACYVDSGVIHCLPEKELKK